MSQPRANAERGEAILRIGERPYLLRPSFTALVAAEEELGPLFALVERAGEGRLSLREIAYLFWHCLVQDGEVAREAVGEAVLAQGLAASAGPLRLLLKQVLQGSA